VKSDLPPQLPVPVPAQCSVCCVVPQTTRVAQPPDSGHQFPVQPQFPQCQGRDLARRSASTKPAMSVLSKFVSTSQFPEKTMDYFQNEI
jgi:hypothetical protein